jgi:hypothetical protein
LGDISVLGRLGSWESGGTAEGELRALQAGIRHTCKQKHCYKQLHVIIRTGKNKHVEEINQFTKTVHFQILAKSGKGIQVILRHCNIKKNVDTATVDHSADN